MEKNNREQKNTAMKTVGGEKRKLIIIDDDDDDKKRCWSDLPYELLELIKKGLFFIDQVTFRVVCKSWSCVERVPPLQQIPWLLVFDNVDSCKLVDSKNKKTYTIATNVIKAKFKITNFGHMRVHESKYGWLLISPFDRIDIRLFLYSPFFSEGYNLIELPVLMKYSNFCATFTSNPLEEDCKILTLGTNYPDIIIINTYGCGQGSWSSQKFELKFTPCYGRHLIYSEGSFYYETGKGVMVYSEGSFYYKTGKDTMVKLNLALEEWTVLPRLPPLIKYHRHYTVTSSDGELFLIVECNVKKRHKHCNHESRIYRLNLSSMIWEDLDSIGDRVLFFGDGYNSVVDWSVLKLNGERKDISDMIYYCETDELRYCSVHDFTLKLGENEKPPRKQDCSRHYGSIAIKRCRKMWIDPPPR